MRHAASTEHRLRTSRRPDRGYQRPSQPCPAQPERLLLFPDEPSQISLSLTDSMMGSHCHGVTVLSGILCHRLRYGVSFSHLLPGLVLFEVLLLLRSYVLLAPDMET